MNLDATLLNDLQGTNAQNDKRFAPLGYVDIAKDSTSYIDWILPSQIEAMSSMSSLRNLKIPVIKDQTVTVGSVPSFANIPANLEESDVMSWTAVDIFSGMRHYPALYANNQIDEMTAVMAKMKNIAFAMGQTAESYISTVMEARKSQVIPVGLVEVSQGDGTFTFNTGTDTLTVSKAAQKETMFFNLLNLMEANKLGGDYGIVTNRAGLSVQKAEQLKFSVDNTKNLEALGMFPMNRMYGSDNLSIQSGEVFTGFLVRMGGIGLIENYPFDFRRGTEFGGRKWSVSDVELPFLRMKVNVYVNRQPTDATALVGAGADTNLTMTHFEEMAFWCRFYIPYRYNSDIATRANDIVKIVGATT
jgi:hypothetical protein